MRPQIIFDEVHSRFNKWMTDEIQDLIREREEQKVKKAHREAQQGFLMFLGENN